MPAFDVRGEYVPQDVVISRLRMTCAYFVAATTGRLVAADTTRTRCLLPAPGDPGADVTDLLPVGHLYATEVAALGRSLGVPAMLLEKPTAGPRLAERYEAVPADLSPTTVDRALAAVVDRGEDPEPVARALDADSAAVATLVRAVERRRCERATLDRR
jgi:NAD+ synthase